MSTEEAMDIGLVPPMDSVELGFKNFLWRVKMQWEDNGLWLGREWNHFARTSNLKIGDKCLLISTSEERKFEVAVLHRDQMEAVYKSGNSLELLKSFYINRIAFIYNVGITCNILWELY